MPTVPAITLRYFDCRGRAQAFRYYLKARNIAFIDARVSLKDNFSAWPPVKQDRNLSGPFGRLPVLHWGKQLVAESSVIHHWLHDKLGDEARLSEQENLQHAMLASSCRGELSTPMAMLLYQDLMYPGVELKPTLPGAVKRISDSLTVIESALMQWQWFELSAKRPLMLADCLLWEMLDWANVIFGPALQWNKLPGLSGFHRDSEQAALFRRLLAEHPCPITARPQEAEAVRLIRTAL